MKQYLVHFSPTLSRIVISACLACCILFANNSTAESLAITNVTVIDCTGAPAKLRQTVVIEHNRIIAIEPSNHVSISKETNVIDGHNKFVIPGMWDMHVHTAGISAAPTWGKNLLPLYLANGITGIRDMAGDLPTLANWKQQQIAGTLDGPRMAIAGPFLDGSSDGFEHSGDVIVVHNSEEARRAVDKVVSGGSEFIKIGSRLCRECFYAISAEAKIMHVPFGGHLPEAVSVSEASDAGATSIEHLFDQMVLSSKASEIAERAEAAAGKKDSETLAKLRAEADATYSPSKAASLFEKFIQNHTWMVPTLSWTETAATLGKIAKANPNLRYLPPPLQAAWALPRAKHIYSAAASGYYERKFKADFRLTQKLIKAGVPLLPGSDSLDPYVFPGESLRRELALFVQAGMTPMAALQSATRNPAIYFGRLADTGTIEKEKLADLVLLDADPLKNISNVGAVRAVILNGRFFSRADLDRLLRNEVSRIEKEH